MIDLKMSIDSVRNLATLLLDLATFQKIFGGLFKK